MPQSVAHLSLRELLQYLSAQCMCAFLRFYGRGQVLSEAHHRFHSSRSCLPVQDRVQPQAPALVRCSMVLRMVKPDETTSSITTTLLPSTPAKTSERCPPSSSLILRATLSSRSIPEAMHVANGIPLMEIPTIESTSPLFLPSLCLQKSPKQPRSSRL